MGYASTAHQPARCRVLINMLCLCIIYRNLQRALLRATSIHQGIFKSSLEFTVNSDRTEHTPASVIVLKRTDTFTVIHTKKTSCSIVGESTHERICRAFNRKTCARAFFTQKTARRVPFIARYDTRRRNPAQRTCERVILTTGGTTQSVINANKATCRIV